MGVVEDDGDAAAHCCSAAAALCVWFCINMLYIMNLCYTVLPLSLSLSSSTRDTHTHISYFICCWYNMPVIQEKKMRFSNSSSHTQDTKQDRVMMMRRIQQRGMISFQKTSNVSRFFTTRTNQNRMLLQKTALRYCSTESLRQEVRFSFFRNRRRFLAILKLRKIQIAVLRDQIEALQHRNAIGLQRFRDVNVMSLEDLTKERTILHFTESQRRVVELISLEDKARPVGSYRYLAMAHPRDIAMVEEMIWKNCTRKDASKRAAERFANIARRISLEKNVYLSDFKIGFDERLRHGITLSENPEDFDTKLAANEIRSLREQKLIGERKHDEMLYLVDLLSSAESESELRETWINFRESIRQLYTLRWRLGELLIGRKRLADGTELPLWQAIYDSNSVCLSLSYIFQQNHTRENIFLQVLKVDIWAEVVDELGHKKFSLVTNFFTLDYEYEDSEEEGSPLKRGSLTMPFEKNYRHNIAEDIEK